MTFIQIVGQDLKKICLIKTGEHLLNISICCENSLPSRSCQKINIINEPTIFLFSKYTLKFILFPLKAFCTNAGKFWTFYHIWCQLLNSHGLFVNRVFLLPNYPTQNFKHPINFYSKQKSCRYFFFYLSLKTLTQREEERHILDSTIKRTSFLLLSIHGIVITRQIKVNLVHVYWNLFIVVWHALTSIARTL